MSSLLMALAPRVPPAAAVRYSRILSCLPAERQTLLFSATMTKSLIALQKASLSDAHVFQVGSVWCGSGRLR